jgi:RND family efflux transporter MFP subunit
MIIKRFSFLLVVLFAAAGIFATVNILRRTNRTIPIPKPLAEPARSPYGSAVAATGIIEATRENVKIAPPRGGLIQKVLVQVGSKVKTVDPLIQLDNREAAARLATLEAQYDSLKAAIQAEKVMGADAADQLQRITKLRADNVASDEEQKRKDFALQASLARVAKLEADAKAWQAQIEQSRVELEVLTIRAPRDGTILQVNVRAGEYADPKPVEPLLVLGEVEKLQVRAEVDEQNAPMVVPRQPAVAFLKGSTQNPMRLRFVRIEPFVIPKRSLTGDSTERVDTRVLQIIFELDRPESPLYVGQQVDVFIQRPDLETVHNN